MGAYQTFNQDANGNIGTAAAVTTSAPTYTTGSTAALSLTLNGLLRMDGSGVTQPISAAALPLPSGASTSALQTAGNLTLVAISGQIPATLGQKAMAASLAVAIASDQSAIPITAAALPLPTGAATSALQTSGNATLTAIAGQLPTTLGQKTSANSFSIVVASDQSPIPVTASLSSTAVITSVNNSITTGVLLASNTARRGFIVYNDSQAIAFIAFAATASTTAFSVKLQPGAEYEPGIDYTGVISAISSVAVGACRITEFT